MPTDGEKVEIMRRALRLMREIAKELDHGSTLLIRDKDGELREIHIPKLGLGEDPAEKN